MAIKRKDFPNPRKEKCCTPIFPFLPLALVFATLFIIRFYLTHNLTGKKCYQSQSPLLGILSIPA